MSRIGLFCLFLGVAPALTLAGCGGGDGGGGRVARGRFNLGKKDQDVASRTGSRSSSKSPSAPGRRNQAVSANLDDLNPESSMQRDLAKLRERERSQVKVVEEMRTALDQGTDMVQKEERKLADIRSQIARYDNAVRGYQQSSHERAPGGRETQSRADYARTAPQNEALSSPYAVNANAEYHPNAGGEEVLYNARNPIPMNQPAPAPRNTASRGGEYNEKPFAGATVTRARVPEPAIRPAPQAQAPAEDDELLWNPPSRMYADRAVQPKPIATQGGLRPNGNAAPAPQAVAKAPAAKAAPAPAVAPAAFGDTEVFSPDLYLSGGR